MHRHPRIVCRAQAASVVSGFSRTVIYHDAVPSVELHQDLRSAVRDLCKAFPDSYWRELDAARAYPDAFVKALTDAGYLAALIPEEYGGSGLGIARGLDHPRGDQPQRRQRRRVPRADVHDGHAAAARLRRAEARVPAEDRDRRAAAAGVRRHRADDRLRHDAAEDDRRRARATRYVVRGQKVWISRAEHSDLLLLVVRTTPIEQVKKRTEGLSILLVDLREAVGHGLTIRPIRTMMNHATTELFFDDLEVPVDDARRRGRQGLPLSARRAERRADSDRGRVRRRRPLVHRARDARTRRSASSSTGRSARTRACSSRSRARTSTSRPPI